MLNEFIQKFSEMLNEDRPVSLIPRVHGWLVAPSYKLARQLWRELKTFFPKEWIARVGARYKVDNQEMTMETIYGGLIEVKSADNPEALVGSGIDIMLVTEFARIQNADLAWANMRMRLASAGRGPRGKGGLFLANSTPRGYNTFRTLYEYGLDKLGHPDWESFHATTYENPEVPKEELDQLRKEMPERLFRQEVLAEFLDDGGGVFPPLKDLIRGDPTDALMLQPVAGERYVLAWDPAKSQDFSVVGIRDSKGRIVYFNRSTGRDWVAQTHHVAELSRLYNYASIVLDATGVGNALQDSLRAQGLEVEALWWTGQMKEQLVNHASFLLEQKKVELPNIPVLISELEAYEGKLMKSGRFSYGAPENKHDDCVSMFIMLYKDFNPSAITVPFMGTLTGARRR